MAMQTEEEKAMALKYIDAALVDIKQRIENTTIDMIEETDARFCAMVKNDKVTMIELTEFLTPCEAGFIYLKELRHQLISKRQLLKELEFNCLQ